MEAVFCMLTNREVPGEKNYRSLNRPSAKPPSQAVTSKEKSNVSTNSGTISTLFHLLTNGYKYAS